MKKILYGIIIAGTIFTATFFTQARGCPKDVKQCPDTKSYVVRISPLCKFPKCPARIVTKDGNTNTGGMYAPCDVWQPKAKAWNNKRIILSNTGEQPISLIKPPPKNSQQNNGSY